MSSPHAYLVSRFWRDRRGAAAVELVLTLPLMVILFLNIANFGLYVYSGMEVSTAAEGAAQAIYVTCAATGEVPATTGNCPNYSTREANAAHSTSLGTHVSVTSTTENYYCVNSSGSLVALSGTFPGNKTTDCTSVNSTDTDPPGDYVLVSVSYNYTQLFSVASLAVLFPTTISRTAWIRVA